MANPLTKNKKKVGSVFEEVDKQQEEEKQIESAKIAENATKEEGVTQADLDRAREMGIDVFNPKNLKQLSKIDIAAAQGKEQAQSTIEQLIESERGIKTTDPLQEILGSEEAKGRINLESGAKALAGATIATGALLTPLTGGVSLVAGAAIGGGLLLGANLLKGIVTGEIKESLFATDAQSYVTAMPRASQEIIDAVKAGEEPLEALRSIKQMRDQASKVRATMTTAIINNPALRDEGGLLMLQQLARAEEDLETKREIILKLAAQSAITPTPFTKEERISKLK